MVDKTREEEIDEQAQAFCKANPLVGVLFVKFTFEVIERGFRHYSAKSIFERIRWETDQSDSKGRSTFKINNNYTCWFARRFMDAYPHYAGFFRTRSRVSAEQSATDLPELTPADFDGWG